MSTPATLVAGALAGALSWLLLYPIDVIKTNMQASVSGESPVMAPAVVPAQQGSSKVVCAVGSAGHSSAAGAVASQSYSDMSVWRVGVSLYQKRGISVFFNGVGTAVFRAMPVNAVTFYIYEKLKETELLKL